MIIAGITIPQIIEACDRAFGSVHSPAQREWLEMAISYRDNPVHLDHMLGKDS